MLICSGRPGRPVSGICRLCVPTLRWVYYLRRMAVPVIPACLFEMLHYLLLRTACCNCWLRSSLFGLSPPSSTNGFQLYSSLKTLTPLLLDCVIKSLLSLSRAMFMGITIFSGAFPRPPNSIRKLKFLSKTVTTSFSLSATRILPRLSRMILEIFANFPGMLPA